MDQPGEHLGRAVARVGDELTRRDAEVVLDTIDHPLGRGDLGLADCRARFDIDDNGVLDVDQIVGGVAELGLATVRGGVTRRGGDTAAYGSFEAFAAECEAGVAEGRFDGRDFPAVLNSLARWERDGTWGAWQRDRVWQMGAMR